MKTPDIIRRREFIKCALVASICPTALASRPGHAFLPWLLRVMGATAARTYSHRTLAQQVRREVNHQVKIATARQSAKSAAIASAGTLVSLLGDDAHAQNALRLLLDKSDQMIVPEASVDVAQLAQVKLPTLDINKVGSLFLDVPPLSQSIQDQIAWAAVDVRDGSVKRIGKGPLAIMASSRRARVELPLGYLTDKGPHRFIALLETHANAFPITTTNVYEVI